MSLPKNRIHNFFIDKNTIREDGDIEKALDVRLGHKYESYKIISLSIHHRDEFTYLVVVVLDEIVDSRFQNRRRV